MFTKKDLTFSIFTGIGTGLIIWRIFIFLKISQFHHISFVWLAVIMPIFWILGVNLGYLLGRWINFLSQFGKFVAIGFTNAAVDFGVLNLLLAFSSIGNFALFKTISFLVALVNSYLLNKHWAFEAGKTNGGGTEFIKFASVATVSILINVGVASYIVKYISPLFGFSAAIWANMAAIMGSAAALVISFLGFKLLVFKTRIDVLSN